MKKEERKERPRKADLTLFMEKAGRWRLVAGLLRGRMMTGRGQWPVWQWLGDRLEEGEAHLPVSSPSPPLSSLLSLSHLISCLISSLHLSSTPHSSLYLPCHNFFPKLRAAARCSAHFQMKGEYEGIINVKQKQ